MSRVDRSSEVDFDVTASGTDPDHDEILVEPPDRLSWLGRRARLVLAIVVAAAVVAILVVQAVSAGPSRPRATAPSTVLVSPSSSPSPAPAVPPPLRKQDPPSDQTYCPRVDDVRSSCSTSSLVPTVAVAAVLRHFPGARIRSKVEADLRDIVHGSARLWYREIRASRGATSIVVEVRKRRPADRTGGEVSEGGAGTVVRDQVVTGSLTVVVRVMTAAGRRPQIGPVQRLARDTHLLAPATTSVPRGGLPYLTGTDPSKCPGLSCTTRLSAPDVALKAVRAAFPGAHVRRVTTVRLTRQGRPLWFREVVATSGHNSVQLVVQAHSPSDISRGYTRIEPEAVETYVERELGQWHVFVTVTAPSRNDRAYGQALALAGDARILAT